uniref:Uncharacterized protein n=1 Tax=Phytophthora ramorum TaxID=164328 RepID=H3GYQ7_PHYRM
MADKGIKGSLRHQLFMHQYLHEVSERKKTGEEFSAMKPQTHAEFHEVAEQHTEVGKAVKARCGGDLSEDGSDDGNDDIKVIKVTPVTDAEAPLEEWLTLIEGRIVDVAAQTTLTNFSEGLLTPDAKIAGEANNLKKQVINGMLANLVDESGLHPVELMVELDVIGAKIKEVANWEEQIYALANHYAKQRQKSVKVLVPLHYWVRPAHIKAMTMHARETLYVLHVEANGMARTQVYAYHNVRISTDDYIESGTVETMDTRDAMQLFRALTQGGILPTVLILQWLNTGNHFQAVIYDQDKYAAYTKRTDGMEKTRNKILANSGRVELDAEPYDHLKTTKAAVRKLKGTRKAARVLYSRTASMDSRVESNSSSEATEGDRDSE